MDSNTWKDRIRELRKRLGLSQQALAEKLKCSISSIRWWERGFCEPSLEFQRRTIALEKRLQAQKPAETTHDTGKVKKRPLPGL